MSDCFVYIIFNNDESTCMPRPMKIGISAQPKIRLLELQTASPLELFISGVWRLASRQMAMEVERRFHHGNQDHRIRGEWVRSWPVGVALEIDEICLDLWFETGGDIASAESFCAFVGIHLDALTGYLSERSSARDLQAQERISQ